MFLNPDELTVVKYIKKSCLLFYKRGASAAYEDKRGDSGPDYIVNFSPGILLRLHAQLSPGAKRKFQ